MLKGNLYPDVNKILNIYYIYYYILYNVGNIIYNVGSNILYIILLKELLYIYERSEYIYIVGGITLKNFFLNSLTSSLILLAKP